MTSADTIYAHSSGRPPAAIAVIRISGPQAHQAARRLTGSLPAARTAALRKLRSCGGDVLDEALVLRFDRPASATGEDLVELHCHGGRAVVQAILKELSTAEGLREARPGEFTLRALENGRIDLTEAEGLADLLEAETDTQRRAALAVATGGLRRQVEDWSERLLILSARAEAAIDYVGDEEETSADAEELSHAASQLGLEFRRWLERPRAEKLKDGLRVVLAGPPNAGKSSLLNALIGDERAIVTDIAGTTRDVIEVPTTFEGVPLLLVDTAGLRDTDDSVEQIGVALAERQVGTADILLWLGEPGEAPSSLQLIKVHARADRPERSDVPFGSIAVSAVTGVGLAELRKAILKHAREQLPAEDQLALNQRQAQTIEKAAAALGDLPTGDLVITAEALRLARGAMDRLTGKAGVEDLLDALFGRFCLGK